MAQYKVPQDVEAEDKLIGPFSFRQFVYLLIAGGLIALAVGLFQIFPALAIIPVPFILFFGALALPLKKDQPMETYLAALVSFYLKPRTRVWMPGQKETTILITAPKIVEESRTRDITGEEATHRLSFLADIVDSKGYAIRGNGVGSQVREDLVAEANTAVDMFETTHFDNLENKITKNENQQHAEVIKEMRDAIEKNEKITNTEISSFASDNDAKQSDSSDFSKKSAYMEKTQPESPKSSIIELANNEAYSVATIAKEANRINEQKEGEVFISLH